MPQVGGVSVVNGGPHLDTHVSVKRFLTQRENFPSIRAEGKYMLRNKNTIHWTISTNQMISIIGP